MILIINICKERLHYYEFVRPIEDILRRENIQFFTKHYKKTKKGDFKNATKIIICGTSISDNEFVNDMNYFSWLQKINKPVLGICGGMQIIGLHFKLARQVKELDIKNDFNHILKRKTEIGFYEENFVKDFLGLKGKQQVYHLHNYYTDFSLLKDFEIFSDSEIPQAIKHKTKLIYGILFHPEVRNKEVIVNFVKS